MFPSWDYIVQEVINLIFLVVMILLGFTLVVALLAGLNEFHEKVLKGKAYGYFERPGHRRVDFAVPRARKPSDLARSMPQTLPQIYQQVPHVGHWSERLTEVVESCQGRCFQTVGSYCQRNPDKKGRVLFRALDPIPPAGRKQGRAVFRCSSASLRLACQIACLCDKSDEICPSGYHLQVVEPPPDAPEDSQRPTVMPPLGQPEPVPYWVLSSAAQHPEVWQVGFHRREYLVALRGRTEWDYSYMASLRD